MDFITLISVVILGVLNGGFSVFLDFCFNEGNIFDFYYQLLVDYVKPKSEKLFKMLGGCNICFNVYITTIIYEIYHVFLHLDYIYFIPYLMTSVLFNMYLNGYFNIEEKNNKNRFKLKKRK